MTDRAYDLLSDRLTDAGHDVAAVERALGALVIETPSWGYGDSGTRFATFQQAGRPRDVFERLEDAAEVNRLTGSAGAVALHFPWDQVDDYGALRRHADEHGLRIGATNVNLFQDPDYKLGSLSDVRAAAAASTDPTTYEPSGTRDAADATYERFLSVTGLEVGAPAAAEA